MLTTGYFNDVVNNIAYQIPCLIHPKSTTDYTYLQAEMVIRLCGKILIKIRNEQRKKTATSI